MVKVDASSQTEFEELDGVGTRTVATQYLVGEACADQRTHEEMEHDMFKVFCAMTIQGARQYLDSRHVRHSSGTTKLAVTETCVRSRMRELDGGQYSEKYQGIFDGIRVVDRRRAW